MSFFLFALFAVDFKRDLKNQLCYIVRLLILFKLTYALVIICQNLRN